MTTDSERISHSRAKKWLGACAVALVLVLCLGALMAGAGLLATAWITGGGVSRATPVLDASRPAVIPTIIPSASTPMPECPAPVGFSATGIQVGLARVAPVGPV